jgi:hypothetical protein
MRGPLREVKKTQSPIALNYGPEAHNHKSWNSYLVGGKAAVKIECKSARFYGVLAHFCTPDFRSKGNRINNLNQKMPTHPPLLLQNAQLHGHSRRVAHVLADSFPPSSGMVSGNAPERFRSCCVPKPLGPGGFFFRKKPPSLLPEMAKSTPEPL